MNSSVSATICSLIMHKYLNVLGCGENIVSETLGETAEYRP